MDTEARGSLCREGAWKIERCDALADGVGHPLPKRERADCHGDPAQQGEPDTLIRVLVQQRSDRVADVVGAQRKRETERADAGATSEPTAAAAPTTSPSETATPSPTPTGNAATSDEDSDAEDEAPEEEGLLSSEARSA